MTTKSTAKVKIRLWSKEDIPGLVACHEAVYPDYKSEDLYEARNYMLQFERFPEGQYLAEVNGEIVGYATSIIVQLEHDEIYYSYQEITGAGTFTTHNPAGDTLYGADIGVRPEYRQKGVSGQLYQARKKLLKKFNLKRLVAHGRIPGYKEFAGRMTAEEYVQQVIKGNIKDQALNAHLKAGYIVKKVLLDYVRDDSSMNYATWIVMDNPEYSERKRKISASPLKKPNRRIRVCAAQYQMRRISTWEEILRI